MVGKNACDTYRHSCDSKIPVKRDDGTALRSGLYVANIRSCQRRDSSRDTMVLAMPRVDAKKLD
jgi:hypothetical protein